MWDMVCLSPGGFPGAIGQASRDYETSTRKKVLGEDQSMASGLRLRGQMQRDYPEYWVGPEYNHRCLRK